jgi:hypothetical protein
MYSFKTERKVGRVLLIKRSLREKNPINMDDSAILFRKDLQDTMPFISLLGVEMAAININKGKSLSPYLTPKLLPRVFTNYPILITYHDPHFTGKEMKIGKTE